MKQRGRKSAAALEVSAIESPLVRVDRPDAPYDLTDEQAEEWWAVVNSLPADWFARNNVALLTQYCRHVVSARRVSQLIEQVMKPKELDQKSYFELLNQQEKESRAITALLRSMRLTQQATIRAETAKPNPRKVGKPWES